MPKVKMTLLDVCNDLRSRGMGITQKTLTDGIESGAFPFGKIIATGATGRRTFLIMRRDYEAWADEYLPAVFERSISNA